jgi:threonine synthase|tara:strand:- start:1887 stop:3263 length:1377 start_codon:yes stop_codon:yes gene_type:complete
MNYLSTRDKSLNFNFKDIFLRGLAPDGGLFLPSEIRSYNKLDLKSLSKLSYSDLAVEILFNFCSENLSKDELRSIIKNAYKNFEDKEVVSIKKIGNINLLELYHGPTLAFKDIAMQVIGNMYDQLKVAEKKPVNVVVATSGDTGSAAIAALNGRKNINLFVLHPHNKISNIQRKIMTTIGSNNIFNIAIEGSFDDCQRIVKDLFNENDFREKINMSGVNSINWARIICQIVYYFYAYFSLGKEKISFSVPTGNFGDVYAGYVAKKMGLPIDKLIVATNKNNILQRVINTGEYKPDKVEPSLSPSMDIQVSSNFERLLFYILKEDDQKVKSLMKSLKEKGSFILEKEEISEIKKHFQSEKINDDETLSIIKEIYENEKFIIDPHTATAFGAINKIGEPKDVVVLGTAHPYKFLETVKKATGKNLKAPHQLEKFIENDEKFDIIENNNEKIKEYILNKIK